MQMMDCLYSASVERCATCGTMILNTNTNNQPHVCATGSILEHYRINAMGKETKKQIQMRTDLDHADCFYYQNGRFNEFYEGVHILSPATNGFFSMEKTNHSIVRYESTRNVRFIFYVVVLNCREQQQQNGLRVTVTKEGTILSKTHLQCIRNVNNQSWSLNTVNWNTVFVMGLMVKSNKLKFQVKCENNVLTAIWQSGWDFAGDQQVEWSTTWDQEEGAACHNCSGNHDVEQCDLPNYTMHCKGCLVVSLNGAHHENPCQPVNRISQTYWQLMQCHYTDLSIR